jgi:hypothetical protein
MKACGMIEAVDGGRSEYQHRGMFRALHGLAFRACQ